MRLTALLAAAAAMAALATTAGAAGLADQLNLTEAKAQFPDRSYVLSLPTGRELTINQVHVTENGTPVHALSLLSPTAASGRQFAVVLALDTSNSMRGAPIAAAVEAARVFAAHRNPHQQVAVVAFNNGVRVVQPFTTDGAKIQQALSRVPKLAEGTKIYDALDRSATLIEKGKIANGSVVLLSDGADVGSVATKQEVLKRLADRHVRVFAVGLASKAFDPAALAESAQETGGRFVQAGKASELEPIFDQLGFALSREYLVSYRSLAGPGENVAVNVRVDGYPDALSTAYQTPRLDLSAPTYHEPLADRIVTSPFTMLVVVLFCALLVGWGTVRMATPRRGTLVHRMSGFVSLPSRARREARPRPDVRLGRRAERSLSRFDWWPRFVRTLELADVTMPPIQIVVLTLITTFGVALLLTLVLGPIGALVAIAVPFGVRAAIHNKLDRKRRAFANQLPENLEMLASGLRAGMGLVGALAIVVDNSLEPSKSEFRRAIAEEQLGVPLEAALAVIVERMDNRDLEQVALVARLQRETGSNSAEVLDRVVETIRGRMELRRLISTLTAQGRLTRWVLTAIPFAMAAGMSLVSPGYLSPLFDRSAGRVLLVLAGAMMVAGSLVMRKIVNIKV